MAETAKKKTTKKKKTKKYDKSKFVQKVIERIEKQGYHDIKSTVGEFDDPKSFKQVSTESSVTPDVTATSAGKKYYFEVALKSDKENKIVNKWKLLSHLASMKGGQLFLYAPHGHKSFTQKLVQKNEISANVLSL